MDYIPKFKLRSPAFYAVDNGSRTEFTRAENNNVKLSELCDGKEHLAEIRTDIKSANFIINAKVKIEFDPISKTRRFKIGIVPGTIERVYDNGKRKKVSADRAVKHTIGEVCKFEGDYFKKYSESLGYDNASYCVEQEMSLIQARHYILKRQGRWKKENRSGQ